MKAAVAIPIVLIVVAAVSFAISAGYPLLQAKIMPMIVCGVIILLAIVQLASEVHGRKSIPAPRKRAISDDDEEEIDQDASPRAYLREAGWMLAFFLIIYAIGFLAGIGAFTALYAGTRRAGWPVALGLGLSMALLSYVLFAYLVNSELYPGIIPRLLGLTE
jgi:hypothetical protein